MVYEVRKMLKCRDQHIVTCNWTSISDDYECCSLSDRENILKLNFDDVTAQEVEMEIFIRLRHLSEHCPETVQEDLEMELFNEDHPEQIIAFAKRLTIPAAIYSLLCRSIPQRHSKQGAEHLRANQQHFAAFIRKFDGVIQPNPRVERQLRLKNWCEVSPKEQPIQMGVSVIFYVISKSRRCGTEDNMLVDILF